MDSNNCKPARISTSFVSGKGFLCGVLCALIVPINGFAAQNSFWDMCKENPSGFLRCKEVSKVCPQVQSTTVPHEDKPSEHEKKELEGCSSDRLFHGYGDPSDSVKARKCAYLQIEQNQFDGPFDGIPVLMTVYANGDGVKQNYELALKFACDDDGGAPAEYENRILSLDHLRMQKIANASFDYCDGITSGYMMGFCAARSAEIRKDERVEEIAKIVAPWSEGDKREFEKVRAAWKNYLEESHNEVDQSGTARAAFVIEHEESLEKGFFASLIEFDQGKFPSYGVDDFVQTDREMNRVYKKIQNTVESDETQWGTVTKEDIKRAQRAWLKYRDVWVAFAKQKYPSISAAAWKTWLTRERVGQIKSFLDTP